MSGWELAREIRLINSSIPIAVITGWGEAVGSHEQKAAGVDWIVAKPFTADRIAELVRDIERLGNNAREHLSPPENVRACFTGFTRFRQDEQDRFLIL